MALCESQLDSAMPQIKQEESTSSEQLETEVRIENSEGESSSTDKILKSEQNGTIYRLNEGPSLPLSVDYRSPVSHFIPPAVEIFASRNNSRPRSEIADLNPDQPSPATTTDPSTADSSECPTPVKRKRGRPRVDKTSPEYLAKSAARKQAREMAAMMNNSSESGEKRKRGRPRIDKTSPEYLARKKAKELEALEKKAKRQNKRRGTGANIIPSKSNVNPPRSTKRVPASSKSKILRKVPQKVGNNVRQKVGTASVRQRVVAGRQKVGTTTQMRQKIISARQKVGTALRQKVGTAVKQKVGIAVRQKVGTAVRQKVGTAVRQKVGTTVRQEVGTTVRQEVGTTVAMRQKVGSPAGVRNGAENKVVVRRANKFERRKDSAASSSAGDTPRVKRKYTKRNSGGPGPGRPRKTEAGTPGADRVKGKRGRPRKADLIAAGLLDPNAPRRQQPEIRVRNNLMPSETITLDSDDEPNLGSPSQASDSLSLDENLRALRHLHEKYANLERDDALNAQLLAGNCRRGDDVIALSEEERSVKGLDTRVEKLEDSSNSDSDSSTSGSGSSSSSSSSSSGSGSSSSSDSDSDSSGDEKPPAEPKPPVANNVDINRTTSGGAWSERTHSDSESDISESERDRNYGGGGESGSLSESDNESPDKSYQCHVCKKWYSTIVTLKIHRRSHLARAGNNSRSRPRHSDRYECDCCNETFSRREKLWEHKAAAHRGQMTVRCEVCRKCFEDDAVLAAHTLTHTADERAGRCEDCGLTFPRHEQLRRHRTAAHGARAMSHTCAQCGKGFTHAHSLTRHLHNHARQLYRCVVCKASFARADQLAQHLNSHLANYKRLKP